MLHASIKNAKLQYCIQKCTTCTYISLHTIQYLLLTCDNIRHVINSPTALRVNVIPLLLMKNITPTNYKESSKRHNWDIQWPHMNQYTICQSVQYYYILSTVRCITSSRKPPPPRKEVAMTEESSILHSSTSFLLGQALFLF